MSVSETPPSPPQAPPPTPPRLRGHGGCAAVVLVIIGIALLLPGICSLIFLAATLPGGGSMGDFGFLWLICLLIAGGGIFLIRFAIRNR